MTIDQRKLGRAVRTVRKLRKLTQADLAEAAGMAANSVAILERGERGFTLKNLNALAKALDIPAACLAVLGAESPGTAHPAEAKLLVKTQDLVSALLKAERSTAPVESGGRARAAKQVRAKGSVVR